MPKVTLREKKINDGKLSLYLDFWPPIPHPVTGKPTRRKFLKLYVWEKPKNEIHKNHNKAIRQVAEKIASKRQVEIDQEQYSFLGNGKKETERQERNFVEYFKELADKRKSSNHDNWISAYKYLVQFTNGVLTIADLESESGEKICSDFMEYLLSAPSLSTSRKPLSRNSASSYFNKFKAALKQAYKDKVLKVNMNDNLEFIKPDDNEIEFLTQEELQKLAGTECEMPILKQAALFSALTGLRHSDIKKLVWSEIRANENQYSIHFRQKKTKGFEIHPISETAYNLLGERGNPDDKVFTGLVYSAYNNLYLKRWLINAGITKKITFHGFRHTYATLTLSKGADLYTVSKLLGHKDIKTTQRYAKVVDKLKRQAADMIEIDI